MTTANLSESRSVDQTFITRNDQYINLLKTPKSNRSKSPVKVLVADKETIQRHQTQKQIAETKKDSKCLQECVDKMYHINAARVKICIIFRLEI